VPIYATWHRRNAGTCVDVEAMFPLNKLAFVLCDCCSRNCVFYVDKNKK